MQAHTKIYMNHFNYGEQSFIPCEVCGSQANAVHHIVYRSRGGGNDITNLMALCQHCHELAHEEKLTESYLQDIHNSYLDRI